MKPYLALIVNDLRLALRDRSVIFFNYLFPLVFFFGFGSLFHAERSIGAASLVITSVLVIGVLGNGLFGAGIRAVIDREAGILRRFKVAPISPLPLLAASLVTGWLLYLPSLALLIGLARVVWNLPLPARPFSLFILLSVAVLAFRAIGLIVASVANSIAESNIFVQLLYMPMMFLSGATVPIAVLPSWAQSVATFVPAFYLVNGVQGIFQRGESLGSNLGPLAALLTTLGVATFIAKQLFRWEKEQVIRPAAKLWVVAALIPFAALGAYDARTQTEQTRTRALYRNAMRQAAILIRGGRIFVGDGRVLESGKSKQSKPLARRCCRASSTSISTSVRPGACTPTRGTTARRMRCLAHLHNISTLVSRPSRALAMRSIDPSRFATESRAGKSLVPSCSFRARCSQHELGTAPNTRRTCRPTFDRRSKRKSPERHRPSTRRGSTSESSKRHVWTG
jgi:ABC-type multidrug transport system permease subunit